MSEAVYVLCFLTSGLVAALLLRTYARSKQRLLLWCGLGFVGLCANNLALVLDRLVLPDVNLTPVRVSTSLLGVSLIVFGLVWEAD